MVKDYLNELNEPQRLAVEATEGPVIVIAGAGSGKTRVLTYRIAHLIEKGVDSFKILALTFTNKASREMKERIANMVGESEVRNLWMGTFHSMFAKILRSEAEKLGYPSNFTIYDTQDSVNLVRKIITEKSLDKDLYKPKQVFGRISSLKNDFVTYKSYYNNSELVEHDRSVRRPFFGEIYEEYVNRCYKAGAMDFDDLLLKAYELLSKFPEILGKYQEKFRYILVDEYQDTNHAQYLILKALADKYQNICVVGDDSQSIYAFRGANINNILNFRKDYPDTQEFKLEQNYRSTEMLVKAANSVIEKNKNRLDKEIWTSNELGEKIKVARTFNEAEEGRFVSQSIFDLRMSDGFNNSDFAVLYRTNAQSRAIEDALRKKGIAYKVFGGLSFYQRKEIKDVLAYLRFIANRNDEEAFMRIINFPARGIGSTTVNKIINFSNESGISIDSILGGIMSLDIQLNSGTRSKINNFYESIKKFRFMLDNTNAYELTEKLVTEIRILSEYRKEGSIESLSKIENIEELLNGIKDFTEQIEKTENRPAFLNDFLEDVALATSFEAKNEVKESVSMMTIHLAKGLEYPVVFLVGLEENLFPSPMSLNDRQDLEEERRLFYVALTRAEKKALISFARSRYRWGKLVDCEPSRFLSEIDVNCLDLSGVGKTEKVNERQEQKNYRQGYKSYARKPKQAAPEKPKAPLNPALKKLKKIRDSGYPSINESNNLFGEKIIIGNIVEHERFGLGEVIKLEGKAPDTRATIKFKNGSERKLLLKFAKLKTVQ